MAAVIRIIPAPAASSSSYKRSCRNTCLRFLNFLRLTIPANKFQTRSMFSYPHASSVAAATGDDDVSLPKPWLFIGLGNPGKIFQGTRHNVGFEMIDYIAEAEGISVNTVKSKALFGKGHIGDVPIMLAKPQTFMNLSGWSVGSLVSYFKIPINQILVIYDDMDLPFGKLRLLPKGGHGGHNGMRSVISHLKDRRDIPRLKIGIGRPSGKMDPVGYVLRPFDMKEREEIDITFKKGLETIRLLVLEGFNKSALYCNTAQPSKLLNK